jgi:hypothetical protein
MRIAELLVPWPAFSTIWTRMEISTEPIACAGKEPYRHTLSSSGVGRTPQLVYAHAIDRPYCQQPFIAASLRIVARP